MNTNKTMFGPVILKIASYIHKQEYLLSIENVYLGVKSMIHISLVIPSRYTSQNNFDDIFPSFYRISALILFPLTTRVNGQTGIPNL